ncbi:MAG TPA: formylglycine-generating enzyme family protein, partial [Caulobacteraceae bacterium]
MLRWPVTGDKAAARKGRVRVSAASRSINLPGAWLNGLNSWGGRRMKTRTILAAITAVVLSLATSAHADDLSNWRAARQAQFASWQAAHPNVEAQLADLKAKTAAMVAAYVPPPSPAKYADLMARSRALRPDQKAQAAQLFFSAFTLWQSGDFASAKEGFTQGLAIDPANGMANYYMGDIRTRDGAKADAALYMDRAKTLAPGTPEALKATAALRDLPAIEDPNVAQPPVIWRTTSEPVEAWDDPQAPPMVVVPAGEFTMGSPPGEPDRQGDEGPRHRVHIGYALAVSKYPITRAEYAAFVAETRRPDPPSCYTFEGGSWKDQSGRSWRNPGFAQTGSDPAVCISFDDATAYAGWLSQKTGHAYRLLSEAEYEYGARAGSVTAYWWGDDPSVACGFENGADLDLKARFSNFTVNACHDGYAFTSPVGSFRPNPFGLYDMSGDAWSWTADCYSDSYSGAPQDGSANSTGSCGRRVLRGGSWGSGPRFLRAAYRNRNDTGNR